MEGEPVDEYSKALPIAKVNSKEQAMAIIVRYGRRGYDNKHYYWSTDEFDGTVEGIFRVEKRIIEDGLADGRAGRSS